MVLGGAVLGIILLLALYLGLVVTGVIDTRPGTLVVVAKDAQKTYDGTPLSSTEYEIKSGTLKKGHKIHVTSTASQVDAGTRENVLDVKIYDSIGADVTNHYRLEVKPGTLTVHPQKLVLRSGTTQKVYDGMPLEYGFWEIVSGELPEGIMIETIFSATQTKPGQCKNDFTALLFDKNGRDASRNFNISYLLGTLTVTKRPFTISSYGASKIYDGQPLSYEKYATDGELLWEHYLDVTFPASITDVGSVTNNMQVRIMSEYGDVTDCYEITVRVGTLKVEPRPIEISATPCIKNFTGDELPRGQWYLTKGTLVQDHVLSAEVEPILNDEGTVEFMIRNVEITADRGGKAPDPYFVDVSSNYAVTLVHGIDRDQLYKLTVASGSKSMPYSGQPLTCEQYVLTSGKLADGHRIEAMFTGSQTEIGMSANTFTIMIIDGEGQDVTYRYDVQYEYGTLEVYANVPGSGGEIVDDGSIDQGGAQNPGAVAARIWADRGGRVYLRWKNYGEYIFDEQTGTWKWTEAMAYPMSEQNMLFTTGKMLAANGHEPTLYSLQLLGGQYLLPNFVAEGPEGAVNDVCLAPTASAYSLTGYSWSYSYAQALEYAAMGLDDEQMRAYTTFVYNQYLAVPESTKAALLEIAGQNGLQADRLSIIEDVAAYVRSAAVYDVNFASCPEGKDEVIYFLTESKSGVCRHFASAATLMYRALGIPARYVVGYSSYVPADTWTEVTGAQAHAWVEVFIPGLGWVRMDPTPADSGAIGDDALVIGLSKVMGYYTGLPLAATEDNVMILQGDLEQGHVLAYVEVLGSRIEAGSGTSSIGEVRIEDADGNDVTAEYNIVRQDGVIEVRRPVLRVTATSAKKVYDGSALVAETYTHSFTNAPLDRLYTVIASVGGQQTEVGQSAAVVGDVTVTDPFGNDITSNFEVRRIDGTLKVYLYELHISTDSATKVYDGTPLANDGISFAESELSGRGHTLSYTLPMLTGVGSIYNSPTWQITDADGNDVSAEYDVRISAGVLRISPVELTVQVDSAQKVYDGKPLSAEGFTLVNGSLVAGQRIVSYHMTGSQTNVGTSEAGVANILIVDERGHDVSANYLITVLPGKLHVTAP